METEVGSTFSEPVLTYRQFVNEIISLDYVSSLLKVQKFSAVQGNQTGVNINLVYEFYHSPKVSHKVLVTRDSLSFICKEIILNCKKNNQHLTDIELINLVNEYVNLITDLNTTDPDSEDSWLWVLRASNLQHYYHRHPVMIIGRYYYIFQRLGEIDHKFYKVLNKKLKLEIIDIFKIGICVWTVLNLNKFFWKQNILNGDIPHLSSLLTEENINNFLKLFSTTRIGFMNATNRFSIKNELLKKYEFNALKRFPIINTNSKDEKEKFIIPSLGDFMYAFSEGLYYVLLDKLNKAQKENLLKLIGSVFEEYIGSLIKYYSIDLLSRGVIYPEQDYLRSKGHTVKSADWILVSEKYIYQIECKKRKNDNYLRAGIDAESGKIGVNKTVSDIAKELDKLIQKEIDIRENKIEKVEYKNQKIINMIVYLDEMFAINNYARNEVIKKMKSTSDNFYILGCYEFEVLCQMCRNNNSSLNQNITLYVNNKVDISQIDFLNEMYERLHATLRG